jgi:hypothetical protein
MGLHRTPGLHVLSIGHHGPGRCNTQCAIFSGQNLVYTLPASVSRSTVHVVPVTGTIQLSWPYALIISTRRAIPSMISPLPRALFRLALSHLAFISHPGPDQGRIRSPASAEQARKRINQGKRAICAIGPVTAQPGALRVGQAHSSRESH